MSDLVFPVTPLGLPRSRSEGTESTIARKRVSRKSQSKTPVDQELVAGTLAGKRECFGTLVKRYWTMAVALALSRINDPAQAEDIAQESFIQAYFHLPTLRDQSRFGGWLSRITIQKTVDHIRKRKREKLVSLSGIPDIESLNLTAGSGNPTLTKEVCQFVRAAVDRLPRKLQGVVITSLILKKNISK